MKSLVFRLAVALKGHLFDGCPSGATAKRVGCLATAVALAMTTGCASLHLPSLTPAPAPVDPFALYRTHNYAAAEAAFDQPEATSSAEACLAKADCARHLLQPAAEFDSLKQAVRHYPKNVPAWIALAQLEERAGRIDRADLALQRALAVDPGSRDAWCERGLLRLRQHRTDDAIACFDRANAVPSQSTDVATTE